MTIDPTPITRVLDGTSNDIALARATLEAMTARIKALEEALGKALVAIHDGASEAEYGDWRELLEDSAP